MNIHKITPSVFYVGINDRTTHKFENLWPLPYGVSYNSYLVKGNDKLALVDGVEKSFMHNLLHNVESEVHSLTPDFLIVNHMEPDHSGTIPDLLEAFPKMKIIGNKITIGMLKGFYGITEDHCFEVKENDTISLGGITLKFIMTPLVHWPETMMTYLEEEGVLFSGDAFGCFGALNGGVVDNEMETDWYIPEMYRYYSNIVAKYGKPVQMALKKLSNIDVKYICSTHGPVWKERIREVVDIYKRMSLYEGEDGVCIVYGSMYGNTGSIADIIANRLTEKGIRNIKIHNAGKSDLSFMISDAVRYKGLIVGSATYNGHMFPPVEEFLTAMEVREIKNKVIATFGSYTWASAACNKMKECFDRLKIESVATMDMKQAPDKTDYETAISIADKVVEALIK